MSRPRLPFTPKQTAMIREMRSAGAGWRAIAAATGRSHVCCRRYWIREMGGVGGWVRARGTGRCQKSRNEISHVFSGSQTLNRPSLPAGSASSWDAITSGTAIDGSAHR